MTLVELMVAFGVFSVLITIAAGIFVRSLRISRFTSAQSAAINNVALTVEEIAREARTAFDFDKSCPEDLSSDCVSYTNYNMKNVVYKFQNDDKLSNYGTIMKSVDGGTTYNAVTDPSVIVKGFFYVTEKIGGTKVTPRVTIVADVTDPNKNPLIHMETSISARLIYYK